MGTRHEGLGADKLFRLRAMRRYIGCAGKLARPPACFQPAPGSGHDGPGRSQRSPETRLGEFAWNLGIAFQLVDDMLDFTSHEKVLGKPVGSDLREGKVTLPLIYALEEATPEERQLVATVLKDGNYDNAPFQKILRMIEARHGFDRVRERAQSFTERARTIMSEFPDSPNQRAMYALTELVTDRDH